MNVYDAIKNNVSWQELIVSKEARSGMKGHSPAIIWFTGLSGSGKTTISKELEKRLYEYGVHTYVLDGDNLRHGLNKDLGFSKEHRKENIRRIGEIAKLFVDAGILVVCAFISPYEEDRKTVRELVNEDEFINVYIQCPLNVCIERDPKGLYKKALCGEIKCFTGIDDPFEEPNEPEIIVETHKLSVEESVSTIMDYLLERDLVNG